MCYSDTQSDRYFSVNVMWLDLVSFTCMRHPFNHTSRLPKCRCNLLHAITAFLLTDIITVSSAILAVHVSPDNSKSAVKIVYKIVPKTLPCGTPDEMSTIFVISCFNLKKKYLSAK